MLASAGRDGRGIGECGDCPAGAGAGAQEKLISIRTVADCGGSWVGRSVIPDRWNGLVYGGRGAGLSAGGFSRNAVRGGDARGGGFDSEGVCGVGSEAGAEASIIKRSCWQ